MINNMAVLAFIIVCVVSFVNLITKYTSLLMVLMCFEAVLLSLLMVVILSIANSSMVSPLCVIIMLSVGACEASIGLSILVCSTRVHGSDMLSTLNLLKC